MQIPNNLSDEEFKNLTHRDGKYRNTNEMLGDLSQLTNNLHMALHRGGNQVTSEVLAVLAEINAMTVKSSRSYIHRCK